MLVTWYSNQKQPLVRAEDSRPLRSVRLLPEEVVPQILEEVVPQILEVVPQILEVVVPQIL